MTERMNRLPSASLHRATAWLVGTFATLALLLSVVGLYGVVAYTVGQRTREIGVRMALGAQRRSVYRLVVGEVAVLVSVGTALGLICAVVAATLMRRLLFGVQSWDGAYPGHRRRNAHRVGLAGQLSSRTACRVG